MINKKYVNEQQLVNAIKVMSKSEAIEYDDTYHVVDHFPTDTLSFHQSLFKSQSNTHLLAVTLVKMETHIRCFSF